MSAPAWPAWPSPPRLAAPRASACPKERVGTRLPRSTSQHLEAVDPGSAVAALARARQRCSLRQSAVSLSHRLPSSLPPLPLRTRVPAPGPGGGRRPGDKRPLAGRASFRGSTEKRNTHTHRHTHTHTPGFRVRLCSCPGVRESQRDGRLHLDLPIGPAEHLQISVSRKPRCCTTAAWCCCCKLTRKTVPQLKQHPCFGDAQACDQDLQFPGERANGAAYQWAKMSKLRLQSSFLPRQLLHRFCDSPRPCGSVVLFESSCVGRLRQSGSCPHPWSLSSCSSNEFFDMGNEFAKPCVDLVGGWCS